MLGFFQKFFRKPEKLKVRLKNDEALIEYSDVVKVVQVASIVRIDAFARDDLTYDTIGFLLATDDAEFPFTEEWDGFVDFMIDLGGHLGFDGDKMVLDLVRKQGRDAFSEWNATVWERRD